MSFSKQEFIICRRNGNITGSATYAKMFRRSHWHLITCLQIKLPKIEKLKPKTKCEAEVIKKTEVT